MNTKQAETNLDELITDIEFTRLQLNDHHIVTVVAVSKYSTSSEIETLYNCGQRAFAENKIQDLKAKQNDLQDLPISWHFIGTLQSNKINNLIDCNPFLFHSIHSLELAIELNKKLEAKNKKMNCLLQINSSYEDSKSGIEPKIANKIYEEIAQTCPNINLKGIMSIGANSDDKNLIKKSFEIAKDIFDNCKDATILSLGMSSDFKEAISCGSTMVRVGSRLFDKNTKN